jgi:hypothetical protein
LACAPKIIFNEVLRSNLNIKQIKFVMLQFDIDRNMGLISKIALNSTKLSGGKIESYKGKNVQILNIKELTIGV